MTTTDGYGGRPHPTTHPVTPMTTWARPGRCPVPPRRPIDRSKITVVGGGTKYRRPDSFAQRDELVVVLIGQYVTHFVVVPPTLSEAQRRRIAQVRPVLPEQRGGRVA